MHEFSTRVTERGSGVFLLEPAPTEPATASVYQMYRFIVSVVLRSIARDRLVLALAQDF